MKKQIKNIFLKKRFLLIGGVLVAALLLAIAWDSSRTDLPAYVVKPVDFVVDIKTTGELQAENSRVITRPREIIAKNQIVRLAPEGAKVKQGDFLVQFDTSELLAAITEKENGLSNTKAELESEKAAIAATMAQLESNLKTQEYSFEQSKIRFEQMKFEAAIKRREQEIEFKKAELSLEQARKKVVQQKVLNDAKLVKAKLNVRMAERELEKAKAELAAQTLTAPIDGLVIYKSTWGSQGESKIKVGDSPWPGAPLLEIPDLRRMQVRTTIDEADVSRVAVGQQVVISVDALPGQAFFGTVQNIAPLARRQRLSNAKSFDVVVKLNDKGDAELRPGMSAGCRIMVQKIDSVLTVPIEAVFNQDGQTVCFLAGAGEEARPVQTGAQNENSVVIEKGLNAGDRITLWHPGLALQEPDQHTGNAPGSERKQSRQIPRNTEHAIFRTNQNKPGRH